MMNEKELNALIARYMEGETARGSLAQLLTRKSV